MATDQATPSEPDQSKAGQTGPQRVDLPEIRDGLDVEFDGPLGGVMNVPEVLRAAVEAANSMICISDVRRPDRPLVFCNHGFRKFSGYAEDEVLGRNCRFLQETSDGRRDDGTLGFAHDEAQRVALEKVRDAVRVGDHCDVVLRNYKKDGTPFWNELYLTPIFDGEGRYVAMAGVQDDVTDRVESERQVRQQAETAARRLAELDAAFAAAPVGIVTVDQELCLVRANDVFVELVVAMSGPHDAGRSGRPAREVLPEGVWQQIAPIARRLLANGGRDGLTLVTGDDAEARLLDVQMTAVHNGERLPLGVSLAVQDVTDVRRKERQLADANEHLKAARISAERAKERAERANQAKDDFLAVLSHELRTPLTPVSAGVELLREELTRAADGGEGATPEQVRDWARMLETIGRNVRLEARLIDDLLDVTRIARGKLEFEPGPVHLADVVRQTFAICGEDARDKGITLEARRMPAAGEGPCVSADEVRLRQIAWNLIGNAIKYTPSGGRVTVDVESDGASGGGGGGWARLVVGDDGTGITPELLPRIFDPFEQDGTNPEGRRGLGLGLAISRQLAEAHGGTLVAESQGRGRGSTFTLGLPTVADAECDDAEADDEGADPADATGLTSLVDRVLLVEDNVDTAKLLSVLIRRKLRAEVVCVGTLARAVEAHGRAVDAGDGFDLILSDVGLPDGSGTDLMPRLRAARPEAAVPPALALSGYGTEGDLAATRGAGFADHLVKPIDFDRLLAAVRTATAAGR